MAGHGQDFDSPVDLETRVIGGHPLKWISSVIAVAAIVLLFGNAISLREWVEEQTPGVFQQKVTDWTGAWEKFTLKIGLGIPRAAIHERWKAAEAARFPGQDSDESDAQR